MLVLNTIKGSSGNYGIDFSKVVSGKTWGQLSNWQKFLPPDPNAPKGVDANIQSILTSPKTTVADLGLIDISKLTEEQRKLFEKKLDELDGK